MYCNECRFYDAENNVCTDRVDFRNKDDMEEPICRYHAKATLFDGGGSETTIDFQEKYKVAIERAEKAEAELKRVKGNIINHYCDDISPNKPE